MKSVKFFTLGEPVPITNALEFDIYEQLIRIDPSLPMKHKQPLVFMRMHDKNIRALRYEKGMEDFSETLVPKLSSFENYQGSGWIGAIDKITFDGDDAYIYIIADRACFSRKIKSGERLNLPCMVYVTSVEGLYVDNLTSPHLIMEKRPNTVITTVDYSRSEINPFTLEVSIEDFGFVSCLMP